jgi:hypothetical protein
VNHLEEVVDSFEEVDILAAEVMHMTTKKTTKASRAAAPKEGSAKPVKQAARRAPHVDDAPAYAPAAAFDDTIARTRGLAITAASGVPKAPSGYQPTDPDQRKKRLRRIASTLRAEMITALGLIGSRGAAVKDDLGKFAPDGAQAKGIADRMTKAGALVAAATSLAEFAAEADQIAISDAVVLLEAVNKQLKNAAASDPALLTTYAPVVEIFATRNAAIQAGKRRAKKQPAPPAVG